MVDPVSIVAQVLSLLKLPIQIAQFVVKLSGAANDARVFCDLVKTIFEDVTEADRLFANSVVQEHLRLAPDLKAYIAAKINGTRIALHKLGGSLEKIRVDDQTTGGVRFDHRVRWVLELEARTMIQERQLAACHRGLLASIQELRRLSEDPQVGGHSTLPTYEQAVDPNFLEARRRRYRVGKPQSYNEVETVAVDDTSPSSEIATPLFALPSVEALAPIKFDNSLDHLEFPQSEPLAPVCMTPPVSISGSSLKDTLLSSIDTVVSTSVSNDSELYIPFSTSDLGILRSSAVGEVGELLEYELVEKSRPKSPMDLARENRRARMKSMSSRV